MVVRDEASFGERKYRRRVKPAGLTSFQVKQGESDLLVSAERQLQDDAARALRRVRETLQTYIAANPAFGTSLAPLAETEAPSPVAEMLEAARVAEVGPMAAVAGAVSQEVGRALRAQSVELVIENGGDLYLSGERTRVVAVYAGRSPLSWRIGLEVKVADELGVCTSSASVGPSLSTGEADAAICVAPCAILADAMATALGNRVKSSEDMEGALAWARERPGVKGALIVMGSELGACGGIKIVDL